MAQLRSLSDHYVIVLYVNKENWGPMSFRMLK